MTENLLSEAMQRLRGSGISPGVIAKGAGVATNLPNIITDPAYRNTGNLSPRALLGRARSLARLCVFAINNGIELDAESAISELGIDFTNATIRTAVDQILSGQELVGKLPNKATEAHAAMSFVPMNIGPSTVSLSLMKVTPNCWVMVACEGHPPTISVQRKGDIGHHPLGLSTHIPDELVSVFKQLCDTAEIEMKPPDRGSSKVVMTITFSGPNEP